MSTGSPDSQSPPQTQPTVVGSGGSPAPTPASRTGGIQAIGGLIAVGIGITGVFLLALATVFVLAFQVASSSAAITGVATGAFGVIGSVVGAYFGVKVGTDQTKSLADAATTASARAGALALHVPPESAEIAAKAANDAVAVTHAVAR